MNYFKLKAKKDGKRTEIKLIEDQIRLLSQEISLRQNQISQLFEKHKLLNNDAQDIADEMLGLEYEGLK